MRRKHLKTLLRPKKPYAYATIRIPLAATLPPLARAKLSSRTLARKLLYGGREDLVRGCCRCLGVVRDDARGAS